jgi:hypothetical protein
LAKKSEKSKDLTPIQEKKEKPNNLKIKLYEDQSEVTEVAHADSENAIVEKRGKYAKIYTNSCKSQEIFITFR